jgi:large subunit ribosomal protein L22
MKVSASLNKLRIAPRKTKLVADLIKGLEIADALIQLDAKVKRACPQMKKLLLSAVANAENNFGLDKDNLYVAEATIGAGPSLKRWRARAYGRAGKILKRTCSMTVVLEERVEGKGRKTKEQMEKEKKARLGEKKKMEKAMKEKREKEETTEAGKEATFTKTAENKEIKKEAGGKSWGNRIFRRKSM